MNGSVNSAGDNGPADPTDKGVMAQILAQGLGKVLEALDEGVHIVDCNGVTVFFNSAMEKVDGVSRREVMGRKLLDFFPSLTRETSTVLKALNDGKSVGDQLQTYTNIHGRQITTINNTFPIFLGDKIVGAAEIARDISVIRKLQDKILDLQQALTGVSTNPGEHCGATRFSFGDILGESEAIKSAVSYARRAARSSSNVLICGESGTGKEMFAQGIHNASGRRANPFIAHNCASLPDGLMEGILFGTCRGSFTGAIDRPGLFEQAHGGTMLLDEVNSIGPYLQAKFLRVLQEKKVRRLGDGKEREIDVRIIATINSDAATILGNKEMRYDLFYRLSVVNISIPPLRERRSDIPLLSRRFIDRYNRLFNMGVNGVSNNVGDLFRSYHWPGNVRELMHVIEGAMNIMENGSLISMEHLPQYLRGSAQVLEPDIEVTAKYPTPSPPPVFHSWENGIDSTLPDVNPEIFAQMSVNEVIDRYGASANLNEVIENIEKYFISRILKTTNYNLSEAARMLGVKRQTLQYKVGKYGLQSRP